MSEADQRIDGPSAHGDVLVEVRNLQMYFPVTAGIIFQRAVDRSSFSEPSSSGYDVVQDNRVGDPTCMAGEWDNTG